MKKYYLVRTEEGENILVVCAEGLDLGEKGAENWVRNRFHVHTTDEITKEEADRARVDDVWEVNNRQTYNILTGNYSW